MNPEEYVKSRCCDKNGKVVRDTITIDEGVAIIKITKENERSKSIEAFKLSCPQKTVCYRLNLPCSLQCSYLNKFTELLNKN